MLLLQKINFPRGFWLREETFGARNMQKTAKSQISPLDPCGDWDIFIDTVAKFKQINVIFLAQTSSENACCLEWASLKWNIWIKWEPAP